MNIHPINHPISINIRSATHLDLQRIREIYNWAILETTSTFDLEPRTLEQMQTWLKGHERLPAFVATDHTGKILGWSSLSPWSDRCAYAKSAEVSLYVDPQNHRQGIGKALLLHLEETARQLELHTLLARVSAESTASIQLHLRNEFQKVGHLKEVGEKFGRKIDVLILQKMLQIKDTSPGNAF